MVARPYGWVRDALDRRDVKYSIEAPRLDAGIPPAADLRPQMPPVFDQGLLQSCTGNSVSAALAYCRTMQGLPFYIPSRLMLYYGARVVEQSISSDCGAQLRDVIKVAASSGACDETLWPYDPTKWATAPSDPAVQAAKGDEAIGYKSVTQDLDHIRACLADGDPIVFGFCVFESFEDDAVANTGTMPMPATDEASLGYHAVLASGYNDANKTVTVRNSWGAAWGDKGYFYMPYDYITNGQLAADFWTIRLVTE